MKEWRDRKNFWSLKNEFLFESRPKPKKTKLNGKFYDLTRKKALRVVNICTSIALKTQLWIHKILNTGIYM